MSLQIGLVYETFETYPRRPGDPPDAQVEFEPESTVEALERAIEGLGHRPRRIGSPHALWRFLADGEASNAEALDAVFNIAEGLGSRNREGWAPTLLEMAGVPVLGSDALTLSLTLDKAWANRFAAAGGLPVAPQAVFDGTEEARCGPLPAEFPLFVKPRWEGTSKGIRASSRVTSRASLVQEVERIGRDYGQPALVEAFVPGPEYTATLLGNAPVEALPVVQRALEVETGIGLHALEGAGAEGRPLQHHVPGALDAPLEAELQALARRAFELFECRDFARVDFRLDAGGRPVFLEINPLPTFATDGTFAILAELEGVSLEAMLARCVQAGLARLGLEQARLGESAPQGGSRRQSGGDAGEAA